MGSRSGITGCQSPAAGKRPGIGSRRGYGQICGTVGDKSRVGTFFSVDEVIKVMRQAGFKEFVFRQTIFGILSETNQDEPVKSGYGE